MKSLYTFSKYRHRHLWMFLFLVAIMMLVLLKHATAQSLSPADGGYARSYFLNAGVGFGGSGTAFQAEADFQCTENGMFLLGIDATSGGSIAPFAVKANTTDAGSLYIGYGIVKKTRGVVFTGSVGLASTSITKYGNVLGYVFIFQNYESRQSTETSLRLQGQVIFAGSFAGLSLTGFANINGSYSYGGLTLGLALGKVNFMRKN